MSTYTTHAALTRNSRSTHAALLTVYKRNRLVHLLQIVEDTVQEVPVTMCVEISTLIETNLLIINVNLSQRSLHLQHVFPV